MCGPSMDTFLSLSNSPQKQWLNIDPGTRESQNPSESSVGILKIQIALIGLLGDNSFLSSMTLTCFQVSL